MYDGFEWVSIRWPSGWGKLRIVGNGRLKLKIAGYTEMFKKGMEIVAVR